MTRAVDSEELHRFAEILRLFAEKLHEISISIPHDSKTLSPTQLLEAAERLYRLRRQRTRFFPEHLFGEPAWDLLLDLFIHGERGVQVSVSSACLGAAVPTTTALRWIKALMTAGLLFRETHHSDGRRSMLKLTSEGRRTMLMFLKHVT